MKQQVQLSTRKNNTGATPGFIEESHYIARDLLDMEAELLLAREIHEVRAGIDSSVKQDSQKLAAQLKNLLIENDKAMMYDKQMESENLAIVESMMQQLSVTESIEASISEKQKMIMQRNKAQSDISLLQNKKQELELRKMTERQRLSEEANTLKHINTLLVKYSRVKFGEINDAYILVYYHCQPIRGGNSTGVTNNSGGGSTNNVLDKTIPICIEREIQQQPVQSVGQQQQQQISTKKTNEEIAMELMQRIAEIDASE